MSYSEAFDADDQISLEEVIAGMVFESDADVSEETAAQLGRDVLHEIVRRLRPDLMADPVCCRYADCVEQHPVALEENPVTCPTCRESLGLPPETK
jgi:hypothetical protein